MTTKKNWQNPTSNIARTKPDINKSTTITVLPDVYCFRYTMLGAGWSRLVWENAWPETSLLLARVIPATNWWEERVGQPPSGDDAI